MAEQENKMFSKPSTVVVGAGVGGIAAVGALSAAGLHVFWIDPMFTAGAFARYRDVPANTKISLLGPHFENLVPQGMDGAARGALDALKQRAYSLTLPSDPDSGLGWCGLADVGDVLSAMSQASFPGVTKLMGTVTSMTADPRGRWRLRYEIDLDRHTEELVVDNVVLSTGCVPVAAPSELLPRNWVSSSDQAAVRVIPPEEALQADLLREQLLQAGCGGVAVVGGGHTGVVLVRSLLGMSDLPVTVRLFIRRPIQLAQWSTEHGKYGAWGFRGLKGAAAELALTHGLVGREACNGPVSDVDSRLELWDVRRMSTDASAVDGIRAVVYCVGYTRGPLPKIVMAAGAEAAVTGCEPSTGGLHTSDGTLPGLYGAGIAFAEDEDSSGAPYPEASLKAFSARARVIAADAHSRSTVVEGKGTRKAQRRV
mmetsp:Transcript_10752/g.18007  ORF Transcript_10752/g.18007 Transcript_10752/m.18007 type:complete len:426 (+) Transcript_10752:192-1469(+)|eukprot:CAMPEP_0119306790 /NCGR_PEP_ID=MMETSP1333-20130426/7457_1 /TAXON_ID=418940 /ORGANISM="Scyphosphaera apsteinii, Strain RCC1455" /LENGTH=425 /DNA_ID=CAMNT_0007310185 /DNA_START=198 /DNA_END=1475 /DNA_ORIENTATION=+